MKVFLKITGLVALYLSIIVSGVFVSFSELTDALIKPTAEIFGYEVDAMLPKNVFAKDISVLIIPHHLVADITGAIQWISAMNELPCSINIFTETAAFSHIAFAWRAAGRMPFQRLAWNQCMIQNSLRRGIKIV